ncbi:hypothetical protein CH63R_03819 [Colletotrichum higginsianum IMI 349063]|uniref:Uncharacterized protein n=1 Tax=Colletotrichum higginsianum (strain IMI 349063) TaxID=759273 RepID=A0A1B7YHH9_COLHI|nr:hypothetical protein CH63R_03819 [Colletotrichum higginsianum IMI 349063]OBR11523.1 hypothetical protein CH63R_03819 [Colletotrichum higginsianum IMI 349063]
MRFSSFLACLVMAPLALAIPADLPAVDDVSVMPRAAGDIELPDLPEDWKTALEGTLAGEATCLFCIADGGGSSVRTPFTSDDIQKRIMADAVPGCLGSLTPGGVTCMWAIAARGLDVKEDSKCSAAIVASILSAVSLLVGLLQSERTEI